MSNPLRVVHVYKDYPPVLGGIEKHIRTLAHLQIQQGYRVTVLVTNPASFPRSLRTRIAYDGAVRVIRAGRLMTVASTPISPRQALYQAVLDADIVHLQFPYPPGEIANFLWGGGRATVITYHSDVVRQQRILRAYHPLLARVLAKADAIIATSPDYVESSPYLQAVRSRVRLIPLGIDVAPFLHADRVRARALRRHALGDEMEAPVVLFVGRLRYYKGVDVLLRAVAGLPQVRLWVVGTGPMETAWRALADRLALGSRVRFWGDVSEEMLPLVYAAADLFVLPSTSRAEAFGLVLVEAMASGLPVISTALGTGTSYVNVHGETGWVVPPGDVGALREAIRGVLASPPERERMGQRARQRALEEFSAERMAERVQALYRDVLAGKEG